MNMLSADKTGRLTSHRESTETPFLLKSLSLVDGGVLGDDDRVVDEAVLVALDLADHVGLSIGRAVVVDDTDATLQSHMDGHLVLGDRVHGGGDEGGLERDALRDGGIEGDVGGGEANVARQEEEVIVRQTAVNLGVHEILNAESIAGFILLEDLLGLGVVQDLGEAVGGTVDRRHFALARSNPNLEENDGRRAVYSQEDRTRSCGQRVNYLVFLTGRVSQERKKRREEMVGLRISSLKLLLHGGGVVVLGLSYRPLTGLDNLVQQAVACRVGWSLGLYGD